MKITVHYPKTKEGMKELQSRIDDWHADCIIDKINSLNCSYERKLKILGEVRAEFKRREVS